MSLADSRFMNCVWPHVPKAMTLVMVCFRVCVTALKGNRAPLWPRWGVRVLWKPSLYGGFNMVLPVWAVLPSLPHFSDILPNLLDRHFSMPHPLFISSFIIVCVCVHVGMCGMLPHTCGGQRVSFAFYVYSRDEGLSHLVTKTFIHWNIFLSLKTFPLKFPTSYKHCDIRRHFNYEK